MASPQKEFRNGKIIDSSSSWGNKGPIPNIWKPHGPVLGDTLAMAAAIPLPPGQTPATPFINIQAPTDAARSSSRAASPQIPPSEGGKSRKSKSNLSEVINANDVQQNGNQVRDFFDVDNTSLC